MFSCYLFIFFTMHFGVHSGVRKKYDRGEEYADIMHYVHVDVANAHKFSCYSIVNT